MHIGPQGYPDRRYTATQVIQRGPHGQRIAADPVRTRASSARGSGFRFWAEQIGIPANDKWNPPQQVVELFGLGAAPELQPKSGLRAALSEYFGGSGYKCSDPRKPALGGRPPSGAGRALWQNLNDAMNAACRGRVSEGRQILEGAWAQFGPQLSASDRSKFSGLVGKARTYIQAAQAGADVRRQQSEERDRDFQKRVENWNRSAEARRLGEESQTEARCARLGKAKHTQFALTGSCGELPWAKILLVLGSTIALYAFATGAGKGLAQRVGKG
jgi:hypothetical protein